MSTWWWAARVDSDALNRPLRVASLIATRADDEERGPLVILHPADARARLLDEGELAWVYGPRRHELATVEVADEVRPGNVVLRDIIGASPSEFVRVIKPEFDRRGRKPNTALA